MQLKALRGFMERVFQSEEQSCKSMRDAFAFPFHPQREQLEYAGLSFDIVLNRGRYSYVNETLDHNPAAGNALPLVSESRKRSFRPHMTPPGMTKCPLDDIAHSPFFVRRVTLCGVDYGVVVNDRPWGYHHFMLVTPHPHPHIMTAQHLAAGFELLRALGPEYEGIFTGIGAGASVYHYHLQVHKGEVAIWRNLARRAIRLVPFDRTNGVRAS